MRLDDGLIQADEHGAAGLAVVHQLADLLHAGLAAEIADLGDQIPLEHFFHQAGHKARRALNALEQNVAREAVSHDHIRAAHENVPRLNVAGEVDQTVFVSLFQ